MSGNRIKGKVVSFSKSEDFGYILASEERLFFVEEAELDLEEEDENEEEAGLNVGDKVEFEPCPDSDGLVAINIRLIS